MAKTGRIYDFEHFSRLHKNAEGFFNAEVRRAVRGEPLRDRSKFPKIKKLNPRKWIQLFYFGLILFRRWIFDLIAVEVKDF